MPLPDLAVNWELWAHFTLIMLYAFWLNYCMGTPLADDPAKVDVGAILFFVPEAMATRRLRQNDLDAGYRHSLSQQLLVTSNPLTRIQLVRDSKRDAYVAGREFFTWERSILCPICLHWWLTVLVFTAGWISGVDYILATPFQAALAYLVNHFIIRKIV